MNKKFLLVSILAFSDLAEASWWSRITDLIKASNGIQGNIYKRDGEILETQKHIDSIIKDLNGHMIGSRGWGTYKFKDYQSYGEGANDWSSVINMANQGNGKGELGVVINSLSKQYPNNFKIFNNNISDETQQKYYALKSQTVLATRAASQLDYNKIQDQISYQQMLQQQIERANDIKSATDLSNRIQVEGNLINLEILRQLALLNQQHAVNEQANLNSALSNAKFLTKNKENQ